MFSSSFAGGGRLTGRGKYLRASEVAEYVYCTRAWRLRVDGHAPASGQGRRAAGEAWHQAHGQTVVRARRMRLLVEEATGARVPFGVIRYRDRQLRVDYTDELRESLLDLLAEMREARAAPDVHRSHDETARCAACSYREICVESLAD